MSSAALFRARARDDPSRAIYFTAGAKKLAARDVAGFFAARGFRFIVKHLGEDSGGNEKPAGAPAFPVPTVFRKIRVSGNYPGILGDTVTTSRVCLTHGPSRIFSPEIMRRFHTRDNKTSISDCNFQPRVTSKPPAGRRSGEFCSLNESQSLICRWMEKSRKNFYRVNCRS